MSAPSIDPLCRGLIEFIGVVTRLGVVNHFTNGSSAKISQGGIGGTTFNLPSSALSPFNNNRVTGVTKGEKP
jgi:hypothetical protein